MLCKDCDKLIQLYWDQQLDEKKRKEVEKHLSECQRCMGKLEALKLIEEKAKRIKIPEPGEAYWESFSQRVRERIISKQKQPFGAKLKEFASNIFVFTPARLRVAAVVASIVLVFIVGKLYMDYRGTIPQRIKPVEKRIPKAEKRETAPEAPRTEKGKPVPAPKKDVPARGVEKIENEKLKMQKGKLTISEEAELKEIDTGKGAELITKKPVIGSMRKRVAVPEIAEQETPKLIEKEAPKAAMRVMADVEKKKPKPRSKISFDVVISETMPEGAIVEYLFVDSIHIPDVDYRQKVLSADSLRVFIDFWSEFIKENPEDIFVEIAYLQIAASYYYLFDKTKDDSIRVEGVKQIEEFLKISKEEETKKSLKQRLEKLKGSKEK